MAEELKPPVKGPDPDITECMNYLKGKLRGGAMDGSISGNRRFCSHLLKAMQKDYPDHSPVIAVKRLINIAFMDPWYADKTTGFKFLYYQKGRLIQIGLAQRPDKNKETIIKVDASRSAL